MADRFSFSVVLEPQEVGGYAVLVPALPEVVAEGDTQAEALANAEEAIRAIVAYRRARGLAIPTDALKKIEDIVQLGRPEGLVCRSAWVIFDVAS